jgi:hypothetical protein
MLILIPGRLVNEMFALQVGQRISPAEFVAIASRQERQNECPQNRVVGSAISSRHTAQFEPMKLPLSSMLLSREAIFIV